MPLKISWSRFDVFDGCRLHHYLRYTLRIRLPRDNRPFLVGSTVHESVEEWAKAGFDAFGITKRVSPEQGPRLVTHFKRLAANLRFLSTDEVRDKFLVAAKAGKRAEELYFKLGFTALEPARIERWFNVPIPGTPHSLIGGIDIDDKNRQLIADLKNYSGSDHGDPRQLFTYALAKTWLGEQVTRAAFLYPLRRASVETIRIQQSDLDQQHEAILSLIDEVEAGTVPEPEPGPACFRCEFFRTKYCVATYRDAIPVGLLDPAKSNTTYRVAGFGG